VDLVSDLQAGATRGEVDVIAEKGGKKEPRVWITMGKHRSIVTEEASTYINEGVIIPTPLPPATSVVGISIQIRMTALYIPSGFFAFLLRPASSMICQKYGK
jgi:hypothetical protein